MRLTNKEADVLAAIELRAALTVDEIRQETGYRSHTIRHALSHLKQRSIIRRLPLINVSALGFSMHEFIFNIGCECKAQKQSLLVALMQAPEVLRISEMGQDFQYSLGICAKNIAELANIIRRITGKVENCLCNRAISTQFSTTFLPRRYLSSKMLRSRPLQLSTPEQIATIDHIDDQILRALSLGGDATRPMIARELAIPLSTLDLRIKKLEARKIITGYIYQVCPSQYQMQSHIILMQTKQLCSETLNRVYTFSEQHPAIIRINECFGDWDFELELEVHDQQEVAELMQELYEVLGNQIYSLKTLTRFRDLKYQFYPGNSTGLDEMTQAA